METRAVTTDKDSDKTVTKALASSEGSKGSDRERERQILGVRTKEGDQNRVGGRGNASLFLVFFFVLSPAHSLFFFFCRSLVHFIFFSLSSFFSRLRKLSLSFSPPSFYSSRMLLHPHTHPSTFTF